MRFFVVFLPGERFLNLPKVYDLARFLRSRAQSLFDSLLELLCLLLMALSSILFDSDGFTLEFLHLLIPVLVEFVEFLEVCLLNFPFLTHVLRTHLVFRLALKFQP